MLDGRTKTMQFVVEGCLSNVALLATAVRTACERRGVPAESVDELELALVEAVTNALKHAYELRPDGQVAVTIHFDGISAAVRVSDFGRAMSRDRFTTSSAEVFEFDASDLDMVPERGMGLAIIKNLMTEVDYETSDGINTLSFRHHWGAEVEVEELAAAG